VREPTHTQHVRVFRTRSQKSSSGRENEMTTPKEDAPANPSKLPRGRFEKEVKEKGYLDEADVTESAILRGLRRARRSSKTPEPVNRTRQPSHEFSGGAPRLWSF
jgi:hypothetical protein